MNNLYRQYIELLKTGLLPSEAVRKLSEQNNVHSDHIIDAVFIGVRIDEDKPKEGKKG